MCDGIKVGDVALCITMGGRADLLDESLKTIVGNYFFEQVIAINDFNDKECDEVFLRHFPGGVLISDGIKRGHHGAVKRMYEEVKTSFVFHTEDDWIFTKKIDFEKIKNFLLQNRSLTSYCFRDVFSFLKQDEALKVERKNADGIDFFDLSKVHDEWYFYTFNPHVILFDHVKLIGDFESYKKERHISRYFKKLQKCVAYADPGICVHIGEGVSVANPNANKKKSRLRVWIRKQLNKLK